MEIDCEVIQGENLKKKIKRKSQCHFNTFGANHVQEKMVRTNFMCYINCRSSSNDKIINGTMREWE